MVSLDSLQIVFDKLPQITTTCEWMSPCCEWVWTSNSTETVQILLDYLHNGKLTSWAVKPFWYFVLYPTQGYCNSDSSIFVSPGRHLVAGHHRHWACQRRTSKFGHASDASVVPHSQVSPSDADRRFFQEFQRVHWSLPQQGPFLCKTRTKLAPRKPLKMQFTKIY